MAKTNSTKVIIPCRLSYAQVWDPDPEDGKYSCSLIIDPEPELIGKIKQAIMNAKAAHATVSKLKTCKQPLRNADEEGVEDPAYVGKYFIHASSKYRPGIVDRHVNDILDRSEVYSGCYCRVSVNFFGFDVDKNKGVAAGLNNIQKVKDGPRLAGAASASDDFDDLGDDEDLFD